MARSKTKPEDSRNEKTDIWDERGASSPISSFADSEKTQTDSGIPVKVVYRPSDLDSFEYGADLGDPGAFPFTRGIYPKMYREKLWTMREYTGFGSASDTNGRFRYLLTRGQTGLSIAFDLPTQLGLDSDDPRSEGEVGKVGVAISTPGNMRTLFEGIPIDRVSTSMTINATASIMLAMYVNAAEERNIQRMSLRGTTQNDILKEYAARNTYIYAPERSFELSVDLIVFCSKQMPKWHPISISGYHMREAGANAVQELAFTFADAIEYVEAVVSRGLPIDSFCSQLSFFFACRNDFLEEIAKLRAARRMWAKIVRDRLGSNDENSMKLKFHVQTSGETLTAQQPDNNVIRVTIQALAGVLGGAQSLHTNSKDEALGLPTERAVTIALRTQQIIADESGITKTVDPLAGSYYLERMTNEIEFLATEEVDRVEKLGGALSAIKSGYIQREIQKSAYALQREFDAGKKTVVGVNKYFGGPRRPTTEIHETSKKSVSEQLRMLRFHRERREKQELETALSKLEEEATRDPHDRTNLVQCIIEATKAGATTGEVSNSLRAAYGEYHQRFGV